MGVLLLCFCCKYCDFNSKRNTVQTVEAEKQQRNCQDPAFNHSDALPTMKVSWRFLGVNIKKKDVVELPTRMVSVPMTKPTFAKAGHGGERDAMFEKNHPFPSACEPRLPRPSKRETACLLVGFQASMDWLFRLSFVVLWLFLFFDTTNYP